jgi:sugar O-acyltransferase (sialic acid O-acetyltransferase NeuD family)
MTIKPIIFWGGTGQAKVLNETLHGTEFKLVLVVDNQHLTSPISSVPIVCGKQEFGVWLEKNQFNALYFAVAIGGDKGRHRLAIADYLLGNNLIEQSIIHPSAYIAHDATLDAGAQILASSTVCTHVKIGRQVIINTSASVDHDCVIHDGVHVGPGACLAGAITIGKNAFIGAGAVILPHLEIGENAVVGAGAVVTKSVPANQVVAGNPARYLNQVN